MAVFHLSRLKLPFAENQPLPNHGVMRPVEEGIETDSKGGYLAARVAMS